MKADSQFNITIVGLGLIGGSLAMCLNGFRNCKITGMDIDDSVLKKAVDSGIIDYGTDNAQESLENADIVIISTYPEHIPNFIEQNAHLFKKGSIITDACGVKSEIVKRVNSIAGKNFYFIGGHPMAGKERGGLKNASKDMFRGAGYILTPTEETRNEDLSLLKEMVQYMGFGEILVTTPEHHDFIIAYTSQLMHVLAVSICDIADFDVPSSCIGGSLKDFTRIACINETLWTELFLNNKQNLCTHIDSLISSLSNIKEMVARDDWASLHAVMKKAGNRRETLVKGEKI